MLLLRVAPGVVARSRTPARGSRLQLRLPRVCEAPDELVVGAVNASTARLLGDASCDASRRARPTPARKRSPTPPDVEQQYDCTRVTFVGGYSPVLPMSPRRFSANACSVWPVSSRLFFTEAHVSSDEGAPSSVIICLTARPFCRARGCTASAARLCCPGRRPRGGSARDTGIRRDYRLELSFTGTRCIEKMLRRTDVRGTLSGPCRVSALFRRPLRWRRLGGLVVRLRTPPCVVLRIDGTTVLFSGVDAHPTTSPVVTIAASPLSTLHRRSFHARFLGFRYVQVILITGPLLFAHVAQPSLNAAHAAVADTRLIYPAPRVLRRGSCARGARS